jgi:lipid-binding SYLF domain-containing protein
MSSSYSDDGFYTEQKTHHQPASSSTQSLDGPKGKAKVLVKIPQKVIQNCVGLAIFTTLRTGLHISGAGGSGVLIARLPDGSWSPPSGLLIHTLGAGLIVGLDIYDCVCVINSPAALAAFTHPRLSLGGEVSVVAGPIGAGGSLEAAVGRSAKPVYSYMKSRGLYAGLQVDGTVVVERRDENERFYGRRLGVEQILRGEVGAGSGSANGWPLGAQRLMEVVNSADGRREVNETVMRELEKDPTPGDLADGMSEDYYASGGEPMGEKKVYS